MNASQGQVENPALRPFDKLRVLSKVEAQAQGGERLVLSEVEGSRTTKGGGEGDTYAFIRIFLLVTDASSVHGESVSAEGGSASGGQDESVTIFLNVTDSS